MVTGFDVVYTDLTDVPGTGFCFTDLFEVLGTGIGASIPVHRYRYELRYRRPYRYRRYRYSCRTELTEVPGTGNDVVPNLPNSPVPIFGAIPNLPKCPVPVLLYRTYRSARYRYESLYRYRYPCRTELTESVRYRYCCRTEVTEVSGTGSDVPDLP